MHTPHKQCTNIVDNDLHLSLHFFLIFSDFLSIITWITILGNAHRPCIYFTSTWLTSTHHVSSFFLTFCWFSHNLCINYHIRKCAQTMWTAPHHHHHHPYFFLILLLFMWKCKTFHIWHFLAPFLSLDSSVQTPSTVPLHVNDSLDHIYSFLSDLLSFVSYICIDYYICKWAQTTSTVPQHCQQQSILCLLFFLIFFWFSGYTCINYYI